MSFFAYLLGKPFLRGQQLESTYKRMNAQRQDLLDDANEATLVIMKLLPLSESQLTRVDFATLQSTTKNLLVLISEIERLQ